MKRNALFAASALALASALRAQTPSEPPPWWNYNGSNDTVSLFWDFNNAANPLVPTSQVLPTWFSPPPGPSMFTNSANVVWIASVNGQPGAIGFTGAGAGAISLLVDNDADQAKTKRLMVQFDAFASNAGSVVAEIEKSLQDYKRKILDESVEQLANGYVRTTLDMLLVPQPDAEQLDFALSGTALSTVAIDNLYISTHCMKYDGDKFAEALGEVDATSLNLDLGAATAGASCTVAAATIDAQGVVSYWVAGRNTAGDALFKLDAGGTLVGAPVLYPQGVASLEGASDLAVAPIYAPTGTIVQQLVFGVVDRRASNGTVAIFAVDASAPTAALVPARTVITTAINGPGPLGLAFSRYGAGGQGSFWIADQNGLVTEIGPNGAQLSTLTPAANGTPTGITGAAFDDCTGNFYWFSQTPRASAAGPLRINGYVHDGWSMQPTPIEWIANRNLPSTLGPGGAARGLEIFRPNASDFRLLCVQNLGPTSRLTVLKGPFQGGLGHLGRCGMRGGLPAFGNTAWQVTLSGCRRALGAILYLGTNNTSSGGVPLPLDLALIGMDESDLVIDPATSFPLQLFANGNVAQTVSLPPPSIVFQNVPVYLQWLVLDPTVVTGMATSQGGATVLY
jgi:hypothetical protein